MQHSSDHLETLTFRWRMQKDPSRLPPLDLLQAFDAAVRHLSFTKAAAERFVTQSAISRQIRALAVDGFDLAIRYLPVSAAVGTPLFEESIQLVCAPSLLRNKQFPIKSLQDLRFHTILQVDAPRAGYPLEWDLWMRAMGIAGLEP